MPRVVTVVAFGDSTTAPREAVTVYPDLLQQHFDSYEAKDKGAPIQVVNAGVRGDHTELALKRLDQDVLAHKPTVVILRFGINDAALDVWASPPATTQRVPLAKFCANLRTMSREIRQQGSKVLLCTPNPLAWNEQTFQLYGHDPYRPDDADGFNVLLPPYVDAIRTVAEEFDLPLVDLWAAFRNHVSEAVPAWQPLLLDGMHPNDAGHRLAADLLVPALDQLLKD